MIDLAWSQISGAVAGGLVGGFSGFIANQLQQRQDSFRIRRNVACALIGEIGALSQFIEQRMRAAAQRPGDKESNPYHHGRGERDYMPVFRGLGGSIGVLPTPLPRDLVVWYTRFAACLERTRELHELSLNRHPELSACAAQLVELQQVELTELVGSAGPLLNRLSSAMARSHA